MKGIDPSPSPCLRALPSWTRNRAALSSAHRLAPMVPDGAWIRHRNIMLRRLSENPKSDPSQDALRFMATSIRDLSTHSTARSQVQFSTT